MILWSSILLEISLSILNFHHNRLTNFYSINFKGDINTIRWPEDSFFIDSSQEVNIVVQVNGKVRANLTVPVSMKQDEIEKLAKEHENVSRHLENKNIIKVIFIKNKILNFVHN